MEYHEWEQRLHEMENKLAFQDQVIETLNQAVICHQLEIAKLRSQLQTVVDKLTAFTALPIAAQSEEIPPPHY